GLYGRLKSTIWIKPLKRSAVFRRQLTRGPPGFVAPERSGHARRQRRAVSGPICPRGKLTRGFGSNRRDRYDGQRKAARQPRAEKAEDSSQEADRRHLTIPASCQARRDEESRQMIAVSQTS